MNFRGVLLLFQSQIKQEPDTKQPLSAVKTQDKFQEKEFYDFFSCHSLRRRPFAFFSIIPKKEKRGRVGRTNMGANRATKTSYA